MITEQQFIKTAKKEVASILKCEPSEIYMAWFSKTLGNAKGLFSSDIFNSKGKYYEVTYNGNKQEYYIDEYLFNIQKVCKG